LVEGPDERRGVSCRRRAHRLRRLRDDITDGSADPENIQKLRLVAARVIDRVEIHTEPLLVDLGGVKVEDWTLTTGNAYYEIKWKVDAVVEPPKLHIDAEGVHGSGFPRVIRQPLPAGRSRTS
jgi:hypothetical protein